MDLFIEFILELALEGTIEISKSRKVPKYIRYPLIGLIILFFGAIIGIMFFVSILVMKETLLGGLIFLALALWMLIMSILKFRTTYLTKKINIPEENQK